MCRGSLTRVLSQARRLSPLLRDLVLGTLLGSRVLPRPLRSRLLGLVGHQVASSASINPGCFVGSWRGLSIGERSFVNYGCSFDLGASTSIGSDVAIGYEAMFVTCSHEVGSSSRRAGPPTVAPIVVEDGCWIGARVVVMPGVTIGRGTVVAAGAVVTSDCLPHSLYAGVPAVRKRALEPVP